MLVGAASIDPGTDLRAHVIERSTPMSTRGNPRADFEEFVVVCSDRLLRTAFLLTRDRVLAEDLVQTALAQAWFAWNRLDAQPETYVRRILGDAYTTWWRRRWRGHRRAEQLTERAGSDDTGLAVTQDLWVALGRLPRPQRAVVVLRYFDDLSEADTAELLGCSATIVRSRTAKALARLRVDPALLPGQRPPDGPAANETWETA
jgi:RNA polymerase sigma-70 factor (sigma-E family)